MARKNLLSGLMATPPADHADTGDAPALPPRRSGGAIGAVGKSFADMRANAVIEIPTDMIDGAGVADRLGPDPEQEALMESLREYGQQVPVLVRHSNNVEGRYDIVYGRRRVAALAALRMKVRAMVRDLPDRQLIVAQGQENTARRDLSFIEKANFAQQMAQMSFDRKVICDALNLDKTVISRMLAVTDAVPLPLIHAIGAAPGTGRDRWIGFARALGDAETAREATAGIEDSDERFEAALATTRKAPAPPSTPERRPWGRVSRGTRGTTITLGREEAPFADWLLARIDDLHAQWATDQTDNNKEDSAEP